MSFEGADHPVFIRQWDEKWWTVKDWLELRIWFNSILEKIIQKYPRFHFVRTNLKTTHGPDGENLLPDRNHKILKGQSMALPPNLKADCERILNLHCNLIFFFIEADKN